MISSVIEKPGTAIELETFSYAGNVLKIAAEQNRRVLGVKIYVGGVDCRSEDAFWLLKAGQYDTVATERVNWPDGKGSK